MKLMNVPFVTVRGLPGISDCMNSIPRIESKSSILVSTNDLQIADITVLVMS